MKDRTAGKQHDFSKGVRDKYAKSYIVLTSQTDPAFLKLIRTRRKQTTLSLDQLKKRLRMKR